MAYKKISGIYKITCESNGKSYVGSSKNVSSRMRGHARALEMEKHTNSYLQSAWDKYGPESFKFELIEQCCESDLLVREDFWMTECKSLAPDGFNFKPAERPEHTDETKEKLRQAQLGKKMSEEAREKIRQSLVGNTRGFCPGDVPWNKGVACPEEVKKKISDALIGKPQPWNEGRNVSSETKEKIASALRGRNSGPHSEETKKKISEANSGKKNGMYGRKHTEEHKLAVSEKLKQFYETEEGKESLRRRASKRKGKKPWNAGKSASEETKRKMAEAHRKRWARLREQKALEVENLTAVEKEGE